MKYRKTLIAELRHQGENTITVKAVDLGGK